MYQYILIWGDSILQISPHGGNDLMYIILSEEQTAPHSMVSERWIKLVMYPIIIADIAPMIPGGLTHFNWPRSL